MSVLGWFAWSARQVGIEIARKKAASPPALIDTQYRPRWFRRAGKIGGRLYSAKMARLFAAKFIGCFFAPVGAGQVCRARAAWIHMEQKMRDETAFMRRWLWLDAILARKSGTRTRSILEKRVSSLCRAAYKKMMMKRASSGRRSLRGAYQ